MANISKYQTASGTTLYTVRYRTPDRRQTQKRGFVTKRDAQAFAATVETSKLRGEYVSVTVGRTTVGTLGPAWLARQRGHMKPTSFHACENVWRNRVAPRWADVRIADVRYTDVATWVAELSAIRGPSLVRVAYSVLARILDDAVKDRMLAANPARGVKLPKLAPARNVYLTASQLDSLATEAGAYRSLVLLLGVGGLRWGEAIALRVCDIDFLRRRVELHRNIVYVDREFIVGSLKSNKNRTVVVPAFVMEALAATAAGKGREDLLWTAPHGGYLRAPGRKSWLAGAVARCHADDDAFPRVTAHDLRHTAASLAKVRGIAFDASFGVVGDWDPVRDFGFGAPLTRSGGRGDTPSDLGCDRGGGI